MRHLHYAKAKAGTRTLEVAFVVFGNFKEISELCLPFFFC